MSFVLTRRLALAGLMLSTCLPGAAVAGPTEVAGVRIAQRAESGHTPLVLNGAGLRSKFVIKVYVAALYVPARTNDAETVIRSHEPRILRLHLLRDIDSKTLDQALQDGLRDNTTPAELDGLRQPATRLSGLMADIGTARAGDAIDLDFDENGVTVSRNGQRLGHVHDADLAHALLRVWLGEHPAQPSLKQALLGH